MADLCHVVVIGQRFFYCNPRGSFDQLLAAPDWPWFWDVWPHAVPPFLIFRVAVLQQKIISVHVHDAVNSCSWGPKTNTLPWTWLRQLIAALTPDGSRKKVATFLSQAGIQPPQTVDVRRQRTRTNQSLSRTKKRCRSRQYPLWDDFVADNAAAPLPIAYTCSYPRHANINMDLSVMGLGWADISPRFLNEHDAILCHACARNFQPDAKARAIGAALSVALETHRIPAIYEHLLRSLTALNTVVVEDVFRYLYYRVDQLQLPWQADPAIGIWLGQWDVMKIGERYTGDQARVHLAQLGLATDSPRVAGMRTTARQYIHCMVGLAVWGSIQLHKPGLAQQVLDRGQSKQYVRLASPTSLLRLEGPPWADVLASALALGDRLTFTLVSLFSYEERRQLLRQVGVRQYVQIVPHEARQDLPVSSLVKVYSVAQFVARLATQTVPADVHVMVWPADALGDSELLQLLAACHHHAVPLHLAGIPYVCSVPHWPHISLAFTRLALTTKFRCHFIRPLEHHPFRCLETLTGKLPLPGEGTVLGAPFLRCPCGPTVFDPYVVANCIFQRQLKAGWSIVPAFVLVPAYQMDPQGITVAVSDITDQDTDLFLWQLYIATASPYFTPTTATE